MSPFDSSPQHRILINRTKEKISLKKNINTIISFVTGSMRRSKSVNNDSNRTPKADVEKIIRILRGIILRVLETLEEEPHQN